MQDRFYIDRACFRAIQRIPDPVTGWDIIDRKKGRAFPVATASTVRDAEKIAALLNAA